MYRNPAALDSISVSSLASPDPTGASSSALSSLRFSRMCTSRSTNAIAATTRQTMALALPPGMNRGESVLGYMYDP